MKTLLSVSFALLTTASAGAHAVAGQDAYELVQKGKYIATLGDCTACHGRRAPSR